MGYHAYFMNDSDDSGKSENDNFDGLASLHYLFGKYEVPPWTFRLEGHLRPRSPCPASEPGNSRTA